MSQWYLDQSAGALNMDTFALPGFAQGKIGEANENILVVGIAPLTSVVINGGPFTYSGTRILSGSLSAMKIYDLSGLPSAPPLYTFTFATFPGPFPSAAEFSTALLSNKLPAFFETTLSGDDFITSAGGDDLLRGYLGNDMIEGGQGADTIFGGPGNDSVFGISANMPTALDRPDSSNYLRGDEGNDTVTGGTAFDDINGNQGNDVCIGFGGDDWVVGGKDDDALYGDEKSSAAFGGPLGFVAPIGNDIVYGNLGNDTCDGGGGDDTVRGGQGDDVLTGRDGNDWLSGDRGSDTMTGGAGADVFHSFGDAGLDRVTDFNLSQGDRVQLDPGTTYTVSQVGGDTVIDMTGGGQVILVGVAMSSLTGAWIIAS